MSSAVRKCSVDRSVASRRIVAVTSQFAAPTAATTVRMSSSSANSEPKPPSPASTSPVEVRHQKMQSVRLFLLNRPKAHNALNKSMIENIVPQLQVWEDSNLCKVVVLTNPEDSKAFCAGGDVKSLVLQAQSGKPEDIAQSLKFFEEEYKLNHLIGTLRKPFVSIMNGITMGGGVGLSVHAPFRVATEKTLFAMPETAIGLFPDVGGSFFLPRLDGELGTYLGLTGASLKGEEVFMAGIATHYIPSERLPALMSRLAELETDELEVINMVLEEFVGDTSLEKWQNWSLGGEVGSAIDRCFQHETLEKMVEALEAENSDWARKTIATLKEMSPLSLKVTIQQLRRGRKQHFSDCFEMEYNMARHFLMDSDFCEGVKAKLVEKPRREPKWDPTWENMEGLSSQVVDTYFDSPQGSSNSKAPKNKNTPAPRLAFLNGLTYWDYPHRPMSGLPSVQDIQRVVQGKGRRHTTLAPPQTKEEVVQWFEQNWGGYDSSVIGTAGQVYVQNQVISIEGGFGRGKSGLREKVRSVLDRYVKELAPEGATKLLRWIGPAGATPAPKY
ncbi:hypothetical protein HKX48_001060 [Thoreauomyces humboldtii]|nr:hypothetical protein HKX48_001060 [Thoreauomyces humboldtii]